MSVADNDVRKRAFVVIASLCVVVAVLYTLFAARTAKSAMGKPVSAPIGHVASAPPLEAASGDGDAGRQSQAELQRPFASPSDNPATQSQHPGKAQAQTRPRLIALNWRDSVVRGSVELADLDAVDGRRTPTKLYCERIHVAAGNGICLSREIELLSAQTVATLVDANFQPRFSVRTDGIPTRARMSPDGRYAAFTVFVTGHSYGDAQLSTATLLLEVNKGTTVANLEQFKVLQDGNTVSAPDFNYWGVTFQDDSNFFYATLRTGGVNYLVRGDIRAATVTVVYKGVECPSLSPDQTRIAFKKMITTNNWRLTVLDLRTLAETPLAESRSVDDQAEWLDDEHVLYGMVDQSPWMSIMVVPADGTGHPGVFAKGAASPAVVRR